MNKAWAIIDSENMFDSSGRGRFYSAYTIKKYAAAELKGCKEHIDPATRQIKWRIVPIIWKFEGKNKKHEQSR